MDNNELLIIVLAFVLGYMCSGMMKQMGGGLLVEGECNNNYNCDEPNTVCSHHLNLPNKCVPGHCYFNCTAW